MKKIDSMTFVEKADIWVSAVLPTNEIERRELDRIGSQIGYGRSQQILGELWDESLHKLHGLPPGRGSMGVTGKESAAYRSGWEACMKQHAKLVKRLAKVR